VTIKPNPEGAPFFEVNVKVYPVFGVSNLAATIDVWLTNWDQDPPTRVNVQRAVAYADIIHTPVFEGVWEGLKDEIQWALQNRARYYQEQKDHVVVVKVDEPEPESATKGDPDRIYEVPHLTDDYREMPTENLIALNAWYNEALEIARQYGLHASLHPKDHATYVRQYDTVICWAMACQRELELRESLKSLNHEPEPAPESKS